MPSRIRSACAVLAALVCLVGVGAARAGGLVIFSGTSPKIVTQQTYNNGAVVSYDQTSDINRLNDPSFLVLYGNGTFSWIPSGSNPGFGNLFPVYGKVKPLPSGWIQLTSNDDSSPPNTPAGTPNLSLYLNGVILPVNGQWYAILNFSRFSVVVNRDAQGNYLSTSTGFQSATFVMGLTVE